MIYFTSDLHLGHKGIISLSNRPYDSVEEMDKAIIKNWNDTVCEKDTVYILGDITMGKSYNIVSSYLNKLNGDKIIIKGNHDKISVSSKDYLETEYVVDSENSKKFVMFHYPIDDWNGKYRGAIHVHGHTHSSVKSNKTNRYNVCLEANAYKPVSVEYIIKYLKEAN